MRRYLFAAIAHVLFSQVAAAQDLGNFTKILLPAYSTAPVVGVSGATFTTRVVYIGRSPMLVYGGSDATGKPSYEMWNPSRFERLPGLDGGAVGPFGRFLYVEREHAGDLSLAEVIESTDTNGTKHVAAIPVARAPFASRVDLLGFWNMAIVESHIPAPSRLVGFTRRNTLRVYDFDGDGHGAVFVSIPDKDSSWPFSREIVLPLDRRGGSGPEFPYYGEVSLDVCGPGLAHDPCPDVAASVTVEPLTSGLRFYPIVSSTDNKTQEVTIFTADPPSCD